MADGEFTLNDAEKLHRQFMLEILKNVAETPLVLKGGTALMLAYGLDRFSEDLDFDSPKKLHLESKITHSARLGILLIELKTLKNTETVTRYRARYNTKVGERSLKIEISHRDEISESDVVVKNTIRVYKIEKILDLKLLAAHDGDNPRTAIRDLYDIDFIARRCVDQITHELTARLKAFAADPDVLYSRYEQAYLEDVLVQDRIALDDLVLRLHEISSRLS